MTITLNPDQEKAIKEAIRNGKFASADEFIASAIASLQQQPAAADSSRRAIDLDPSYIDARFDYANPHRKV